MYNTCSHSKHVLKKIILWTPLVMYSKFGKNHKFPKTHLKKLLIFCLTEAFKIYIYICEQQLNPDSPIYFMLITAS